jgi:hypothetical protein
MAILVDLELVISSIKFEVKQSGGEISGPALLGNLEESIWDLVEVLDESLGNPEEYFDVKIKVRKVETYLKSAFYRTNRKDDKKIKRTAAALTRFVDGCKLDEDEDREWLESEKENAEQFYDDLGSGSFRASLSKTAFAAMVAAAGALSLN